MSNIILCVCIFFFLYICLSTRTAVFSIIFFYIFVNQSSYPSISLSANLTLFVCLTIFISVFKPVCLCVTQLIYDGKLWHCFVVYILECLSFYKFVHKPVFLYVWSVLWSVCLSIYIYVFSVNKCVTISFNLSICLYIS